MFYKRVNGKSRIKFKITLSILAIVFVVSLLAPETFAAEKTILKLNLKPGQKYNRVITIDENISQSMAGQQMDIAHTKKVGLEFEVQDVDAKGVASVMVTYRTLQEKSSSTAGSWEYDSIDPNTHDGNPLANTYKAMIGEGFVMKVTDNGRIAELTGFDEMFSQMAEKIVAAEDEMISTMPPSQCTIDKNKAANRKESQEQLAKRRIEGMNKQYGSREGRVKAVKEMVEKYPEFSKEQIRLMLAFIMTPFPDKPVQAGETWTDKKILIATLPAEIECTYTLKEDKDAAAVVSGNFERTMKDPAIDYHAGEIQVNIKMDCFYQRSSEINKSSGWMIRSNEKLKISGNAKMSGNTQMPEGMETTINIESTITVEPYEN